MMSKLEQRSDWDSIQDKHCPIDLLSAIREISHNTEDYDVIVVQVMWTRLFLEAQGYTSETTIYQDNTSAMLMERNGTERSSKQTRHINIRYYYIKDCTDKRLLDIKYCPTDDMLGGFPSKPLQGKKFVTHLKDLLNFEFMTSVVHRSAC
jgi:hypothetical protein